MWTIPNKHLADAVGVHVDEVIDPLGPGGLANQRVDVVLRLLVARLALDQERPERLDRPLVVRQRQRARPSDVTERLEFITSIIFSSR